MFHNLSYYQFDLPQELIAQTPCNPRDSSRLMIIDRKNGQISEIPFRELSDFLTTGDQLIFNNTKVIPARLIGTRETGGQSEVFLIKPLGNNDWDALVKPGRKLRPGSKVHFSETFSCEIIERLPDGGAIVHFSCGDEFYQLLEKYGQIPLPQYIRRKADPQTDSSSYQTVYARELGAVAAPTAGLHFTKEMLSQLTEKGIYQTEVTLHVGIGTFRPVQTEDIRDHAMHTERVSITDSALLQLNQPDIKRQICVGTTSCRALESASTENGVIQAGDFETKIFIYPGYKFKYVKSLLTNFHLPGSSLLMLVSALAGPELIKEAYAKAIEKKFRFYSYGDAMLII